MGSDEATTEVRSDAPIFSITGVRRGWKWLKLNIFPEIVRDWKLSWRDTKRFFKSNRWSIAISFVVMLLVFFFVTFPNDASIYQWIGAGKNPEVRKVASEIGHVGNVAQYNLGVVIAFWAIGRVRKSRYLQRLAVMIFLTTTLAGVFCNVFRVSLGRARPWTGEESTLFVGPQLEAKYHGFPSGHTSTAFGTAVPPLVCTPIAGVPITLFAGAMSWARIYDKHHYPSDVFVGAYIGTVFGLAGGLPLMRVRRRAVRIQQARAG